MTVHCWAGLDSLTDPVAWEVELKKHAELPQECNFTCMLVDGHTGPHQWTPDDQITVRFADG